MQKKILILMTYFNRPKLVVNALNSIVKNNELHQNWELVFGDDNSKIPGEPIVREVLAEHLDKVTFIRGEATLDEKLNNGITIGVYANKLLKETDADYAITLCDDDELYSNYLFNLNNFFNKNADVWHCYSDVIIYNPLLQKSEDVIGGGGKYNKYREPINGAGKIDASQVAWRIICNKVKEAWYMESTLNNSKHPWASNLDQHFFNELYEKCGPCVYTGFISQYKGIHDYQLLWFKDVNEAGLRKYVSTVEEYGGEKF